MQPIPPKLRIRFKLNSSRSSYAAIMSTVTGDFSYLRNIWAIAGPFVGAIVAHYFRHDQKEHP